MKRDPSVASVSNTGPEKKGDIFYGWWIVGGATLAFAINSGIYFYGFGAFFLPLAMEFGVTRAALSGAFSLSRLEGGITDPFTGFLVDRLGPRKVMLVGVFWFGLGMLLLSRVTSLFQFYMVFILVVSLGAGAAFGNPALTTVANWFIRQRSRAMGITISGVGFGGLIVPILGWSIATLGWRWTLVGAGLLVWAIGFPLAAIMRHRPEQYGYLPDGQATLESTTEHYEEEDDGSLTVGAALKSPAFWLLGFAFALRVMVTGALVIHLIPFLTDRGINPELAALILGSVALVSIIGRLVLGWLGDLFDKRYLTAMLLASLAGSMLLVGTTRSDWQLFLFLAIYAPSYGGLASLMHAIRAEYFGRRHFGAISGLMSPVSTVGTITGPFFAGYVYDVTGSYQTAFLVFAATTIVAMVLVLAARRPIVKPAAKGTLSVGTPPQNINFPGRAGGT